MFGCHVWGLVAGRSTFWHSPTHTEWLGYFLLSMGVGSENSTCSQTCLSIIYFDSDTLPWKCWDSITVSAVCPFCTWFSIYTMPEQRGINIHRWQFMDSFITHILFVSLNRPWGSDYGLGWPPVLELYSSSHRPSVNAAGQVHRFDWLWT